MEYDFDVIVIGGGAAGGTASAALAATGLNVAVVERGPHRKDEGLTENEVFAERVPFEDRTIEVDNDTAHLYTGSGIGGGTNVYGAALLRATPDDFRPGKHYGRRIDRSIHEWPIQYEDLADYYALAEKLYRVPRPVDSSFGPIPLPQGCDDNDNLPLAAINEKIVGRCGKEWQPFRLPLGIERRTCQLCTQCAGFPCPTGARISSRHLMENAGEGRLYEFPTSPSRLRAGRASGEGRASEQPHRHGIDPITLLPNREVQTLHRGSRNFDELTAVHRETNQAETYRARYYLFAAGAIGTSILLGKSGIRHPMLGSNYMYHYSPVVAGVFYRATGGTETFLKQLGFGQVYYGTPDCREKMGLIQSLPVPGPELMSRQAPSWIPRGVLQSLRRRMVPLVGIVEDLPNPRNRVSLHNDRITLNHRFGVFDVRRGTALAKSMRHLLKIAGAAFCLPPQLPPKEHVGHQCGTARFGTDAKHAVADRDCRLFGVDNAFVIDGSILPTSLGVGPSLTLMANALRVADIIGRDFSRADVSTSLSALK